MSQPIDSPALTLDTTSPVIPAGTSQSGPVNVTAAAGPVAANTETLISHTVTSTDTNYDGLVVPPVNPYLFATDPTIRIDKRAWVAPPGGTMTQDSAETIEATGIPAPKGTRLSDRQTVCFVYTVSNTSQDDWATSIKNITVTDSDTRLGVIGTITEIPQGLHRSRSPSAPRSRRWTRRRRTPDRRCMHGGALGHFGRGSPVVCDQWWLSRRTRCRCRRRPDPRGSPRCCRGCAS